MQKPQKFRYIFVVMFSASTIFLLTIGFGLISFLELIISIFTSARIWPPGDSTIKFYAIWTPTALTFVGLVLLIVLDWNSWVFNHWTWLLFGALLIIAGQAFAGWARLTLGARQTVGEINELITGGPYAYSRNPMYVGNIITLVGLSVLANSLFVSVVSLGIIAWFLLAPLAEEPVLLEEFGENYEQYRKKTPRFL